jgi:hypothetical protein
MKYIIYGAPGSGSGIVEAACAEIGVDYEVRDLDARNGEHLPRVDQLTSAVLVRPALAPVWARHVR